MSHPRTHTSEFQLHSHSTNTFPYNAVFIILEYELQISSYYGTEDHIQGVWFINQEREIVKFAVCRTGSHIYLLYNSIRTEKIQQLAKLTVHVPSE
jgi:hypothetical protein